uniref:Uncharacterized protein n=1 Tax=Arundo donax TaxID=35708 RepID=A0A0A9BW08_ARUDO
MYALLVHNKLIRHP